MVEVQIARLGRCGDGGRDQFGAGQIQQGQEIGLPRISRPPALMGSMGHADLQIIVVDHSQKEAGRALCTAMPGLSLGRRAEALGARDGSVYLSDEKAFDIAVRLFEANIKAGQKNEWATLVEQIPDIIPNLFDAVQLAWNACPRVSPVGIVDFKDGK